MTLRPRYPYPQHFRNMHEQIQAHSASSPDSGRVSQHARRFAGGVDKDPRTYNRPSSAEVSCVIVGGGPLPDRFIAIYDR
eukprot:3906938-Pyramimonas_sp.AAC.1